MERLSSSKNARRRAVFRIAGNLRKRKSHIYQPVKLTDTFINFVQTEIIPELQLGSRILDKKHDRIQQILANAVLAYQAGGKVLADSRNTGGEARTRIPMYDELVKMESNFKSKLIEWSQHKKTTYQFNTSAVETHSGGFFRCELVVGNKAPVVGEGSSKKQAEQAAAKAFFE